MSVQTKQYLIYGVMKPFQFVKDWEKENEKDFYDTFEGFMEDTAFKQGVTHKDGIFCLYDGMYGNYIIVGRVLDTGYDDEPCIANNKPKAFTEPTDLEKELIGNSIERNFGIKDEMKLWLITHYC